MRNVAIKTGVVAGAALMALLAGGCGSPAPGTQHASVQGCTDFGANAIVRQIMVTQVPAACEGLSKAALDQALGRAIYLVAGAGHRKVAWRERAHSASTYLSDLIVAVPRPAEGPPPGAAAPPVVGSPVTPRGMSWTTITALLAWLLTASSGAYLLAKWILNGRRRPRDRRLDGRGMRLPPPLVSGHLGLAVTGLVLWSAYLGTGWRPAAWTAVGLLLPVAGLGMAVLLGSPALRSPAVAVPAGPHPGPGSHAPRAARRHPAVLVAASHGLLAAATLLLVVLAAVGTR